ncbi:MAG: MBOAT family O-acyltransferase [Phycisphaerales bacterium]
MNVQSGFHLAMVGMFKKVLIADWCAPMVNQIFADPMGQPTLVIWLGTAAAAVQIYCDFSGYTDIARGIADVRVEIPLNFNFPYFSTSIIDFWRRWHISLSSWLRDYLYIPLGGSKCSTGRMYFNLMTTMVLGGLWHGAAWNFVIWARVPGRVAVHQPGRSGGDSESAERRCGADEQAGHGFPLDGDGVFLDAGVVDLPGDQLRAPRVLHEEVCAL